MMPTYCAQTVLIEGTDALPFAHAQFSSNVAALAVGQWQFSAWLDPQGRVKAFFHLARLDENRLLVLLRGGEATAFADALKRFVFRSKVVVEALTPRALSQAPALSLHDVVQSDSDHECILLGCATHSLKISSDGDDDAWCLAQLRNGWPWLPDILLNELVAPALALHRLHAVVIDKGCYPGQEIVARLHYRGGNKKHLYRIGIRSAKTSAGLVPGDTLSIGAHKKMTLLNVVPCGSDIEALTVLSDDIASTFVDGILACNDDRIVSLLEKWDA